MLKKCTIAVCCVILILAIAAGVAFWLAPASAHGSTTTSISLPKQPPGMIFILQKSGIVQNLLNALTGAIPSAIGEYTNEIDQTGILTTYRPSGQMSTTNPDGSINGFFRSTELTTNKRSCATCHQAQNDWEIGLPEIASEYLLTLGRSPLFQPIDSAVCPDSSLLKYNFPDPRFITARKLLFTRGDFRIALNAPNPLGPQDASHITFDGSQPEWVMTVVYDPYGCETDRNYGLSVNQISVYRRPLNACNVSFLDQDPGYYQNTAVAQPGGITPEERQDIMWDAREPDLQTQFIDANEYHGQATSTAADAIQQGVLFESSIFAAQTSDFVAEDLTGGDGSGATGGPFNLYNSLPLKPGISSGPPFFLSISCIDDVTGLTPLVSSGVYGLSDSSDPDAALGAFGQLVCPGDPALGTPVTNLYQVGSFTSPKSGSNAEKAQRESIARGEVIFNTRQFTINGVAGLNEVVAPSSPNPDGHEALEGPPFTGTCTTCHNNTTAANDGFGDPKREGIMDNSNESDSIAGTVNVMPWTSDFPRFAFFCPTGSIPYFSNTVKSSYCSQIPNYNSDSCDEFITTDPGKGLITGKCADLGKMKVPILRGVGARAPYFHGGNALTLTDLVNFYNTRFNIGLSAQNKTDLVNFLNSL